MGRAEIPSIVGSDVNLVKPGSPFTAYASTWCRHFDPTLTDGVDYTNTIVALMGDFPNNTTIYMNHPNDYAWKRNPNCGVWGLNAIAYGNYEGNPAQQPVASRRVDGIEALTSRFDMKIAGALNRFDVLHEFYLTSAPRDNNAKVVEIGAFLHAPKEIQEFFGHGEQLGSFTDAGRRKWNVAKQTSGYPIPFLMAMRAGGVDYLTGSFDFLAMLRWLKDRGHITGQEWFNGMALGMEPLQNSGTLVVRKWAVDYR